MDRLRASRSTGASSSSTALYFTGVLGTIVAALFTRVQTNVWQLDLSLFLAFATLFPDVQILLMLILPIRVKWLGIAAAVLLVLGFAQGDWVTRAAILAAMGNSTSSSSRVTGGASGARAT